MALYHHRRSNRKLSLIQFSCIPPRRLRHRPLCPLPLCTCSCCLTALALVIAQMRKHFSFQPFFVCPCLKTPMRSVKFQQTGLAELTFFVILVTHGFKLDRLNNFFGIFFLLLNEFCAKTRC